MELNMSMKQTQTLSPQMMQSMEILQMGSQELLEYIENQVQENPVLEMEEKYTGKDEGVDLQRKLEWLESTDAQNRVYHQQDSEDDGTDPVSNYGNADETEENLYLYVLSQLELLDLEPELLEAGRFLVESLNQNGWLDEPLEDLAVQMEKPLVLAARALEIVQSLEPAGVGARTLSECLVLQLKRREDSGLAIRIAQDHLDPLSKNRYGFIAKALGATQEQVAESQAGRRVCRPRKPHLHQSGYFCRQLSGSLRVADQRLLFPHPQCELLLLQDAQGQQRRRGEGLPGEQGPAGQMGGAEH